MDKISKEKRSRNMSHIKGTNTKPEVLLRKRLFQLGLRYRLHTKLPGKPDITFAKNKIAVFVNGCFWHNHGCKTDHVPKSNTEFWTEKISRNKERDETAINNLSQLGWKVFIAWECEIKKDINKVVSSIRKVLENN